jgi:hypothetical protein
MANRQRSIPEPRLEPLNKPIRFSFKHLDIDHEKFHVSKCYVDFMKALLVRLYVFSTWTVDVFVDQNNKEHRHIIDFDQTSEKDGFVKVPNIDPEQLGYHDAWQFGVRPEEYENVWRVHGILIDDTFFIVWLDPEHQLYLNNV